MSSVTRWALPFLVLGVIGFADAGYLTFEHYRGGVVPCLITSGCETVTTSSYSKIAGIPVALLGVVNYVVIIVLAILSIDTQKPAWFRRLAWWTVLGFGFSLYFVAIQALVLQAYCSFCLLSALIATILFVLGFVSRKRLHGNDLPST